VITELGDLVTKNALELRQFSGLNRQTRLENNLMVILRLVEVIVERIDV
jgi:hypothetical protein